MLKNYKVLFSVFNYLPTSFHIIMSKWDSFDTDLQDHYVSEYVWILEEIRDIVDDGYLFSDNEIQMMENIISSIIIDSHHINVMMGFKPESILPSGYISQNASRAL